MDATDRRRARRCRRRAPLSADKSSKTEKATPQKVREARKEGTVARSQEIGVAVSLLAGVLVLRVFAGPAADTVLEETRRLFSWGSGSELPTAALGASAARMSTAVLLPFLGAATFAALVAGFGQVGFKPSMKAAKPKLSKLSPKQGLEVFKPAKAGWELIRSVLKLGLLGALVWSPMREWSEQLSHTRGLEASLALTFAQVWTLLLRVIALAIVIGAADYAWNRRKVAKDLRMSKDDIKKEFKNSEGDPLMKGQRRRRQQELSRNRMLGDLGTADVLVVNPTHIAVALRYGEADAAPRVIAKGADHLALKLRKEAYRIGLPVLQDIPLARTLHKQCKVGQHVPAALYEAVAVVLAHAYRRRGVLPDHAGVAA
jgi:flagellar biosynthesis protein FlhB